MFLALGAQLVQLLRQAACASMFRYIYDWNIVEYDETRNKPYQTILVSWQYQTHSNAQVR